MKKKNIIVSGFILASIPFTLMLGTVSNQGIVPVKKETSVNPEVIRQDKGIKYHLERSLCREIEYQKDIDMLVTDKCMRPGKMIPGEWANHFFDVTKEDLKELTADEYIQKASGQRSFRFFLAAKKTEGEYRLYFYENRGLFFQ